MENNFIKFCKWAGTAIEDGNGQVSIKRVIALLLALVATFVIVYTLIKSMTPEKIDWASTCLLLGALFGMISALITASVIEKKHILDSNFKKEDATLENK